MLEPLPPEQLYTVCAETDLGFVTTDDLTEVGEEALHARAAEAMRFALDIRRPGFNLFVLGDPECRRQDVVRRLIDEDNQGPPADDWCYINNFADAARPRWLRLPAGRGARLASDMKRFVGELGPAIVAAFEGDEHRLRVEALQRDLKDREERALRQLGHESLPHGIALIRTEQGFSFMPMKNDEETLPPEEFSKLPEARQREIGRASEEFGERLRQLFLQFPRWRRETRAAVTAAGRQALQSAVGHLIEDLRPVYADLPEVVDFLDEVERDVVESGESLRESAKGEGEVDSGVTVGNLSVQRYLVNVLVDNSGRVGRPVVFEENPTFPNLVGRVEHVAHLGMLISNFTLIQAGALHRANGGILVLDAARLLGQPYAWDALKRALKSGQICIEAMGEMIGVGGTQQLAPQPIPLDVKLVLVGEREAYYLLSELDADFGDAFKVAADFDTDIARDAANSRLYARLLAGLVRREGLRPFAVGAVAAVIEHASRLAEDAARLSTALRPVVDVLVEADYLAGKAERSLVERAHFEAALANRIRRADRLREAEEREILCGLQMISTDGGQVGQVNGLAAFEVGELTFAHPVRLTASVYIGDGDMVDIEREVELGGPIHSKGVMILQAFFCGRYGRNVPPSFAASLVFEQSYGDIDGDSASLGELCALLSALGMLPIKQSLAVTGSVNQFGVVQPIGAVNEKIEGFFDICRARGLTGQHGVLIPAANVQHLMLRADVRQAVADGKFSVYAVSHVDEAIELLTGLPAGEPDAKGAVPKGSVNYAVAAQLAEFAVQKHSFAEGAQKESKPTAKRSAARPPKKKSDSET